MYTLIKKHLPVTQHYVKEFLEMAKELGCGYLNTLNKAENCTSESERTMTELLQSMAEVVRRDQVEDIKASPFFSLQADEATDCAVLKQLAICILYLKVCVNS